MYAGHVALALAARRVRGAPPLWMLAIAAQGADWADVAYAALGALAERLPGDPLWWHPHAAPLLVLGAAGAGLLAWWRERTLRAAGLVSALWLSHWPADWITGLKPTWPGGPWLGWRLFEHPARDFLLEGSLVLLGWALWRTTLPAPAPDSRLERWGPGLAVGALLALQGVVDLVLAYGLPL